MPCEKREAVRGGTALLRRPLRMVGVTVQNPQAQLKPARQRAAVIGLISSWPPWHDGVRVLACSGSNQTPGRSASSTARAELPSGVPRHRPNRGNRREKRHNSTDHRTWHAECDSSRFRIATRYLGKRCGNGRERDGSLFRLDGVAKTLQLFAVGNKLCKHVSSCFLSRSTVPVVPDKATDLA